MRKFPSLKEEKFLRGEHITRHQQGLWSIETIFMKYGKGPRGLIGITLQQRSVKKWAYSLHISTQVLKDLDEMRGGIQKEVTVHKEEKPGTGMSDRADRKIHVTKSHTLQE